MFSENSFKWAFLQKALLQTAAFIKAKASEKVPFKSYLKGLKFNKEFKFATQVLNLPTTARQKSTLTKSKMPFLEAQCYAFFWREFKA